jgi:hypothetical protein
MKFRPLRVFAGTHAAKPAASFNRSLTFLCVTFFVGRAVFCVRKFCMGGIWLSKAYCCTNLSVHRYVSGSGEKFFSVKR